MWGIGLKKLTSDFKEQVWAPDLKNRTADLKKKGAGIGLKIKSDSNSTGVGIGLKTTGRQDFKKKGTGHPNFKNRIIRVKKNRCGHRTSRCISRRTTTRSMSSSTREGYSELLQ